MDKECLHDRPVTLYGDVSRNATRSEHIKDVSDKQAGIHFSNVASPPIKDTLLSKSSKEETLHSAGCEPTIA